MKWSDVQVGDRFLMRVTRRVVTVEVVAVLPGVEYSRARGHYGWSVRNLSTHRLLEVRSPGRFKSRVSGD